MCMNSPAPSVGINRIRSSGSKDFPSSQLLSSPAGVFIMLPHIDFVKLHILNPSETAERIKKCVPPFVEGRFKLYFFLALRSDCFWVFSNAGFHFFCMDFLRWLARAGLRFS